MRACYNVGHFILNLDDRALLVCSHGTSYIPLKISRETTQYQLLVRVSVKVY